MGSRSILDQLAGGDLVLLLVVQSCGYLGLLLLDSYMGTLIALVIGGIGLAILLIALMVELVEPSRVPRSYYRFMVTVCLAPILSIVVFAILRGEIEWLNL
ncbi:MAG: hypothetical protein AAGG53_14340 [Cyanobacteria bacterium P01_H01_bin.152]